MKSALEIKHEYERGLESTVGDRALEPEQRASEGRKRDEITSNRKKADVLADRIESAMKAPIKTLGSYSKEESEFNTRKILDKVYDQSPQEVKEMFGDWIFANASFVALDLYRRYVGEPSLVSADKSSESRKLALMAYLIDKEGLENSRPPGNPIPLLTGTFPAAVKSYIE